MKHIQCIGSPFDVEFSSCSNTVFEKGKLEAIFTSDERLLELDDRFKFCTTGSNLPWVPQESWKMHEKNKLCSMIASAKKMTDGHKYRHTIADRFKDNIDLFGGVCGSSRFGISDELNSKWNDKREGLCDYMFSITMENVSMKNYYTEKITDCFSTGTIPVYWGSTNIGDVFDERGIITLTDDFNLDVLTPELYEDMQPYAEKNLEIVKSLEMADDELRRNIV